jgi:glycosyltransferase involved in cell wall biosynthesis
MKITYFQRKVIANFHFSVEIIFGDVKNALPKNMEQNTIVSTYYSQGVFKRLYNCWEAFTKQGKINHVTGDISYIGIALRKKNTIQTILDCVFLENSSGIKRKLLKYFWLSMPIKKATYITTISNQVKGEIIKHTNCNPDKIFVVPIALSPLFIKSAKPFNGFNPTILMTGSAPNKNIIRMIEALHGIPCNVIIIGKQEQEYINKFKDCSIAYSYKSGLNQQQMLEQYQQADILLFASTYEGFGMPVIEAQAVGIPVLTSSISSMPEVAGNGALLVNPLSVQEIKEGVLKIISNEKYRNEIVENGLQNVKRFNINNIVQQYIEIYKKIEN